MRKIFAILAFIQILFLKEFSTGIVEKHIQMANQQSDAIRQKFSTLNFGQLKLLMEVYLIRKEQEEERHFQELNMKKIIMGMKRQSTIQDNLRGTKSTSPYTQK